MSIFKYLFPSTSLLLFLISILFVTPAFSQRCDESGNLLPGNGEDLEITETCMVGAGTYNYGYVNIYNGGELIFDDAVIDFWAESILIENDSALIADGIGTNGLLTIHLYGADRNSPDSPPIACKTDVTCGVDTNNWTSTPGAPISLPGGVSDYFYAYENLPYWVNGFNVPDNQGYFGHKVLAVSYGGTLILNGLKGSSIGDLDSSDSGTSWARLNGTINPGGNSLTLDRAVDWEQGDKIVVTTTDYLPGNSEQRTISSPISSDGTITVDKNFEHLHNGKKYKIKNEDRIAAGIDRLGLKFDEAETRAAVALLSKSIRIVSEGDTLNELFPEENSGYYYGGHTIFRQGFKQVQVQGVEFYQLGQGGRIGRYPVHFHLARKTPSDTYLKDNSIHDSMTRWITIHGTHGVLLERNVGYKSIGHGFYLEDGTEIENSFYSNIGIFARAAVDNVQNPRKVPGILSAPGEANQQQLGKENVPFHSDVHHPTVFWIMNGWNDFEYNMAAGAGTCGNCYWLVPGFNSGPSRDMIWDSYASLQANESNAGTTPLKKFKGNYCSTASIAFNTVGSTFQCLGVGAPNPTADKFLKAVPNENTPAINDEFVFTPPEPQPPLTQEAKDYYPGVAQAASRIATRCDSNAKGAVVRSNGELDCSGVARCGNLNSSTNCNVTVIDEFTTSFNWTETNFSAIWLRPQWFLVSNSFMSDVQSAGLTFVTGGDYTKASSPTGNWLLAYKNAFVGNTQENNPFASHAGPVGPGGLKCDTRTNTINYCLLEDEGISIPLSNFANNQRLFNIYDGPAQQDSNAYLDITTTKVGDCKLNNNGGNCEKSEYMYGRIPGMLFDHNINSCILPNAAIAWKQPNGFYYPPSFHSTNLFFDKVDIRHLIINPLFETGTRKTDLTKVQQNYCTHAGGGTFQNFTEVDRQTVLNDDDGSLTGYQRTISVNEDPFFNAPIESFECESHESAKASPYEYVTTAVYPGCAANLDDDPNPNGTAIGRCGATFWASAATNQATYGVPMYRQCLTADELSGDLQDQSPSIRLMGMNMWQRSNLTPINAKFYIDTTVSENSQNTPLKNVFRAGDTYYVYLIFATSNTKQTYELYVGENFDVNSVKAVQTPLLGKNLSFKEVANLPSTWNVEYFDKDHPMFDTHPNILRVTVDMSFPEFKEGIAKEKINSCAPKSFCEWKNNACQCSETLRKEDPELYKLCSQDNGQGEHAVCRWSGIDVDCPESGCYGFSFTLPSSFATEDCDETIGSPKQCGRTVSAGGKRPDIECFPPNSLWKIPWIKAVRDNQGRSVAGTCELSPVFDFNFPDSCQGLPTPTGQPDIACNLIQGTAGDDYLSGTSESDVIRGLEGDDLIFGLEGNDFIQGGPGDDLIFGGKDDDTILGDSGDDNLDGHTGNDTIDGGEGFDILDGGSDSDTCQNSEDSFDCEVLN